MPTVPQGTDPLVLWNVPTNTANQLNGWFPGMVRIVPPDRFPEPQKAVLLAGPDCDPADIRAVFGAWDEIYPESPRLCPMQTSVASPDKSSICGTAETNVKTHGFELDWRQLVWMPLNWPLDDQARWILFRALNGVDYRAEFLATDLALARRLEMLRKRNLDLARTTLELRQQALTCPLTALSNRRAMDLVLARELGGGPLRWPTALGLVDIDHFKVWNDRVLHTGGDMLLRGVADRLRSSLRETDLLARIGGEEFHVLARNSDREGALALGERLRLNIRDQAFDCLGREVILTISVGMAWAPAGITTSPGELATLAASALRAAKEEGRDRVVVRELAS